MSEASLEEVILEKTFAGIFESQSEMFFRLANSLLSKGEADWTRRPFSQLISEADAVEALLDDYGARYNRTFSFLREVIASLRSLSHAGLSIAHLERRMDGYPTVLSTSEFDSAVNSIQRCRRYLQSTARTLLSVACEEAKARGVQIPAEGFPESRYTDVSRRTLPRNMGQEELEDDEQKVAEVASKFVQAATMFEEIGVKRIPHPAEREAFLQRCCSEEQARVYEATVHNLQSAYDTWVKNTTIESSDSRLPKLRGHASAALHLLEAVTHLTHFVERHESHTRDDANGRRLAALVNRSDVRDLTLNHLMFQAALFLKRGRSLAEDILPSFTNVQVLEVELREDLVLHARPAALIVGIVNRYGTPVELEVEGRLCNAASILDMMVTVGSNPEARVFRFRGDENPLRDIEVLFRAGLGEDGLDKLPAELAYLRPDR
jgi:phosphotransferase system HPr-like phosphotransfer protein